MLHIQTSYSSHGSQTWLTALWKFLPHLSNTMSMHMACLLDDPSIYNFHNGSRLIKILCKLLKLIRKHVTVRTLIIVQDMQDISNLLNFTFHFNISNLFKDSGYDSYKMYHVCGVGFITCFNDFFFFTYGKLLKLLCF